jgi:hypothetical protein
MVAAMRGVVDAVINAAQSTSPEMVAFRKDFPDIVPDLMDSVLQLEAVLAAELGCSDMMDPTDRFMMSLFHGTQPGQPDMGG